MKPKFVVCIENKNYPASLEFGKIYRVIEDEKAFTVSARIFR